MTLGLLVDVGFMLVLLRLRRFCVLVLLGLVPFMLPLGLVPLGLVGLVPVGFCGVGCDWGV